MRKYGQHFLVNERIIDAIVAAVPAAAQNVVEIGPGRGALTQKLLEKIQFIELAQMPDFQKTFAKCMSFPDSFT